MYRKTMIALLALLFSANGGEKHLFILSGQSNMARLNPEEVFIPAVEKEFGKDNVIVIKDAKGSQPIRSWYKDWKDASGTKREYNGKLYDRLMGKVKSAIKDQKLASVTFLWMQGERDAREKHGEVYKASLKGILEQIKKDLNIEKLNFVIGRLSDFGMQGKNRYPHWTVVREAQVELAKESPYGAWVDTDDLNDGKNRNGEEVKDDLHYSVDGYVIFGKRLAEKAIGLIKK